MGRLAAIVRTSARSALDFALPPRCAGCGTIVPDVHSFCADCWKQVEFLGESGCDTCGLPLQATEQTTCVRCLAVPPRIARTRAAVAYDDLSRSLAIRLKYGRKVAIARTMAHYMAPLVKPCGEAVLVPVPLHRTRLWTRGFNQSALVARELSRRLDIAADPMLHRKHRRGMREGAETGRRGPNRACQLGAGGETFPIDALTPMLKYRGEGSAA
jgi:predicted amidophosphoribosyltransferase